MSERPSTPVPFATGLFRDSCRPGVPGKRRSLADILFLQGQPEIRHERLAHRVEEDIARLDVSVDQALRWA